MRPPTRSTRSVRTHPNKATTSARRSRGASGPTPLSSSEPTNTTTTPLPKPRPQRASSSTDAKVDPDTFPGSDHAPAAPAPPPPRPVVTCFPVFPPPAVNAGSFVLENPHRPPPFRPETPLVVDPHCTGEPSPLPIVSGNLKPPRPRHRMASSKLETLDAFFRRNTHPSRREKEAICKDLDV